MDKRVFYMSNDIPGDKAGIRNFFGPGLLLAGLLFGLRKRGLGDREDGTHGSLQSLKWGLFCGHAWHDTSFLQGGLQ